MRMIKDYYPIMYLYKAFQATLGSQVLHITIIGALVYEQWT